jgi:replicative DNA helicase
MNKPDIQRSQPPVLRVIERDRPHNEHAEQVVLGTLITSPEKIEDVLGILRPSDFYVDLHRILYEIMLNYYRKHGEGADFLTLAELLRSRDNLDASDLAYLMHLSNEIWSPDLAQDVRLITGPASQNRHIDAGAVLAGIGWNISDPDKARAAVEKLLYDLTMVNAPASDFESAGDITSANLIDADIAHEHRGQIMGIPTKYTDLDLMTGGLQRSDLILLAGRPSMGKCLPWWTLIDDPITGERRTIQDCVTTQMSTIYGLSVSGTVRETRVSDWIDSGIKHCYRVTTRLGRMVEVTGHHPFLTVRGWIPLHNLKEGNHIAVPTSVPIFGSGKQMHFGLVRLLAYFIAEGGLTNSSPRFTNTDPVIVEDFKQLIAMHFPTCAIKQRGIDYAVAQPKSQVSHNKHGYPEKSPPALWLEDLGLMGKLATEKFFPGCVWTWDKQHLAEFVRILMSCDGSIYSLKGAPRIEFMVASERLAKDMHHVLVRFGIVSKLYQKTVRAWRVEITAPEDVKKYQEEIGWFGEKSARFAEYEYKATLRVSNNGHAPQETWELVRAMSEKRGISLTELARVAGERVGDGYNPHINRGIPRRRLSVYAEVLEDAGLGRIANPDVYWDEIVSIEAIGEHQVYDLTVPDGSNFIAQDVFVHNTALGMGIGYNAARCGNTVAVFSLEMGKKPLGIRLLSLDSRVPSTRIRSGWLEPEDMDKLAEAQGRISDLHLYIDDTSGAPISSIRSKLHRLKARIKRPIDLVIVDYLQLMEDESEGNKHRSQNRNEEISKISRGLKAIAREFNIPVLALAQLSRAVEGRANKIPQLSDLRESGSLEQDADIVAFVYRDEYYDPESERKGIAEIVVAKHRNGPVGSIFLRFNGALTRFDNEEGSNDGE